MGRLWPLCLILISIAALGEGGGELSERRRDLNAIREQLDKNRAEVGRLNSKETDLVTRLKKMDQTLTLLNNYIAKMGEAESGLNTEIDSIQGDLRVAGRTLTSKKTFLNLRIRN